MPAVDDTSSEESDTEDATSKTFSDDGISMLPARDNTTENEMDTAPLEGWLCYPSD